MSHDQPADAARLIGELSDRIETLAARTNGLNGDAKNISELMSQLSDLKRRKMDIVGLELNGFPSYDIDLVAGQSRRLALSAARMEALSTIIRSQALVASTRVSTLGLPRTNVPEGADTWPELPPNDREELRHFLEDWGLFHAAWYKKEYGLTHLPDQIQALEHYINSGISLGYDPHPLFSNFHVGAQEKENTTTPPILTYIKNVESYEPFPLFDTYFYASKYWDVVQIGIHPYKHYIKYGSAEGRQPHICFEPTWYGAQQLASDGGHLLVDYVTQPTSFRLSPHPLFDANHYFGLVPGLAEAGTNPLVHYLLYGERAGLSPHPLFEPNYYIASNADLLAAGVRPFIHFLNHGDREFRQPHPLFIPSYYCAQAQGPFGHIEEPLRHYVITGAPRRIPASNKYSTQAQLEAQPAAFESSAEPISSFMSGKGLSLQVSASDVLRTVEASSGTRSTERSGLFPRMKDYIDENYGEEVRVDLERLLQPVFKLEKIAPAVEADPDFLRLVDELREVVSCYRAPDKIDLSIIIPVYNQVAYTAVCVLSILKWMPNCGIEILIGDDCSTDGTDRLFEGLGGPVRLIRHETNLGFLLNCNMTAGLSRGEFVLFLNNDTVPLPGAFDVLVRYARQHPTAAVVGSKLLNTDGSLQEAGGVLWNDGSAWNFGRGGNPGASPFNYVKDVDYISGASILVPKTIWSELDGFDVAYTPAYCEDSDFAFRARAAGYRVVYHPQSEVIHHEGRSHGRDVTAGVKKYQVQNNIKFYDRWALTLLRENMPRGQQAFVARDRTRDRPHLLVIDHYVPQWDRDAGSRTMFDFLKAFLARGFKISFWSDNLFRDPDYTKPLQELGIEVIYGAEFSGRFEDWFAERAVWIPYVLLSRPHISIKYIDVVKSRSSAKIIYYGHDLHWARLADEKAITGRTDMDEAIKDIRELEYKLAALSDVVMYPNEEERRAVTSMFEGEKAVLAVPAWFFDAGVLEERRRNLRKKSNSGSGRLLFVGGFAHGPNLDAVRWFVDLVIPVLKKMDVDFQLLVVGSNPPASLLEISDPTVKVVGRVDDAELAGLYSSSALAVVPLRFGGGVKGKVIEAFAQGLPVVSTSVGMQGIPDPDEVAFVADDPVEFAEQVASALKNVDLAFDRAQAALSFVRSHYTADVFCERLGKYVPELGQV